MKREQTFSVRRLDRRSWVLRRSFEASVAEVFTALTEPDAIAAWFPPRGARVSACEIALAEGGPWRTEVTTREGEVSISAGVVSAVEAPHRIVVSDDGGGTLHPPVTVATELSSLRSGTLMTLTFRFGTVAAATAAGPLMRSADATYDRLANFLARPTGLAADGQDDAS